MVSFTAEDHDRIVARELTVTWRLWKYAHVRPGRLYVGPRGGSIEVEDITAFRASEISHADAEEAGFADAASLIAYASSHTGTIATFDTVLYRVRFRYHPEPPPKPRLDLAEIKARLARMDARAPRGAWTGTTLRLIEANPRTAARLLAYEVDRPVREFKADVRKLKALGLTESLEVGYELSELGQAYLDSLAEGGTGKLPSSPGR